MMQPTNSSIDVDDLMVRVKAEVAAMRAAGSPAPAERSAGLGYDGLPDAVETEGHIQIFDLLEDAARNGAPRTAIPKRLDKRPWSLLRPLARVALRLNNYAFKDQRHVNAATEMALRVLAMQTMQTMQQNDRLRASIRAAGAQIERLTSELRVATDARLDELDAAAVTIAQQTAAHEQHLARLEERIGSGEQRMGTAEQRIDALDRAAAQRSEALTHEVAAHREQALRSAAAIRADLSTLRQLVVAQMGERRPERAQQPDAAFPATSHEHILLELADRLRGDRDTIAGRHERYLAVVRESGTVDDHHPLLDIGCGRGEWLSMLRDHGVASEGVDLAATLVQRAAEDGLRVRNVDALEMLQSCDPGSFGAITAFHVIEHLPFDHIVELLDQCLRTLRPGGILIVETPNPANLVIGACNFWLDPTHLRPIPEALARFVIEQRGFCDISLIELTPNLAARLPDTDETARRLNDFVYGPQEYAIVARRP